MMSVLLSLILATTQDGATEWKKVGPARLERGLPQTVPFKYYTRLVYGFGMEPEEDAGSEEEENEKNPVWWDAKLGDAKVGAPRRPGKVDLAKAPRAAWGMMWWGKKLQQFEWREHAEEFIELSLAAPKVGAYHASSCTIDPLVWGKEGSLESDAEVATWYLRWLKDWPEDEFAGEMKERIEETIRACDQNLATMSAEAGFAVVSSRDSRFRAVIERFLAETALNPSMSPTSREKCLALLRTSSEGRLHTMSEITNNTIYLGARLNAATLSRRLSVATPDNLLAEVRVFSKQQKLENRQMSPCDDFGTISEVVDDLPVALLRAGAILGRKDVMERGVAALRAPLNQLSHPTLETNGIKVPKSVHIGAMAPVDADGKFRVPGDWTFERYEGQLLANFAEVEAEFGGYFVHAQGWAVGIDGCRATPQGPVSVLSSNPFPYSGEHAVDIVRQGAPRKTVDVILLPSICRMVLENGKLIAVPGTMKTRTKPKLSGTFAMEGSSWKRQAKIGPKGFECDWPKNKKSAVFTFKGKINGTPVKFGPVRITGV